MKKIFIILFFLICISCLGQARTRNDARLKSIGYEYIAANFDLYHQMQNRIYNYAETGYNEVKSSAELAEHLRLNGFSIEKGVGGLPTAFTATFGSGSPVIGILGEYDALPEGHLCGHNVLGTAGVVASVAISKWLSQGYSGTVKFFGCPAEEGGGGKAYMMREHVFDGVDAMFDWHPDKQNTVNRVSGLANIRVHFEFYGTAAHASSNPEQGRSALDAVEAFNYMMNMMREHIPSDSRIHYVISMGGYSANIVPERAEVMYYIRNPKRTVVEDIFKRAIKAAEGAAMGTGTKMNYEIMSGNYERLPNDAMSEILFRNLKTVGGVNYSMEETEFAKDILSRSGIFDFSVLDAVKRITDPCDDGTEKWVSSDVGNVTWCVPTGSIRVAAFVPAGGGHCWQQAESAASTIGTKGMLNAARVFYLSAIDIYLYPSLLKKIKDEFNARRGADFEFVPLMGDRKPPFDYAK